MREQPSTSKSICHEKLFCDNLWLVDSIINRMYYENINHDDLRQVGLIGLYKASKRYEEGHGTKFSTYATYYILGEIKKEIRDNKFIKVGRKVRKVIALLKAGCTPHDIKDMTGYKDNVIHYGILYQDDVKNLDEEITNDLSDYLHSNNTSFIKDVLDNLDDYLENDYLVKRPSIKTKV